MAAAKKAPGKAIATRGTGKKPRRAPKRLDKAEIVARWQKAMNKCANRNEAHDKGISYVALGKATGVTRQRVYNQLMGPAPISHELYEALRERIRLPAQPPKALPAPRTYENLKEQIRENQRQVQAKVDAGEYVRVPAIILTEKAQIKAWEKLLQKHGGKSAAIRALIEAAA